MDLQPVLEQRAKVEEFTRKHRIGLLTLLFTDLVGSTQLKQELGDRESVALIQRHHALVRELLSRFKEGEEIGTAGDSFFIVFAKPSDAVQFSLLLQAGLRAMGRETSRRLLDRIGLHIGEVVIEERPGAPKPRDMYGLQVDICARVMSLAEGDQILLTRSAFDNARQVLKGEAIEGVGALSWLNHGPYLLKGVDEPMEICEVGELSAAVLKAPADSEKVHRYVSPDSEPVLGWRPAIGQRVSGTSWILEEKLGEGAVGEVWLGRHETLKEPRVFKFCFQAERVRALKREVTLFRLLKERIGNHPNMVDVRDVFFDEPPFYLMIDYVEGGDLRSWCEAKDGIDNVPLPTRLEIVAQIADALQAAHDAGVIHRDVKPSNILISNSKLPGAPLSGSQTVQLARRVTHTDPQPTEAETSSPHTHASPVSTPDSRLVAKLTDFGIGQVVSQEALNGLTRFGFTQTMMSPGSSSATGTQMYMAPELIAGKPASPRTDIYSLGVVLYQFLAEDFTRPVTTDWARDIGNSLLQEDLSRCFAGNPERRFARAGDLARSLRTLTQRQELLVLQESALSELAQMQAALAARKRTAFKLELFRIVSVVSLMIGSFVSVIGGLRMAVNNQFIHEREAHWQDLTYTLIAENSGSLEESMEYFDRLLREWPGNAALWNAKGTLLEKAGKLHEAHSAYTASIQPFLDQYSSPEEIHEPIFIKALINRSALLRRLNRMEEAVADNLLALAIRPRDSSTPSNLVDLSPFYTTRLDKHRHYLGKSLISVPRVLPIPVPQGLPLLDGIQFDVRGIVLLSSNNKERMGPADRFWKFPAAVTGIKIGSKARRLHFLQGTDWTAEYGTEVGAYRVHYADRKTAEIPIVYGRNVRRWDGRREKNPDLASVAWAEKGPEKPLRLFKFAWENPHQDVAIESLDFISTSTEAGPFLVALTAE